MRFCEDGINPRWMRSRSTHVDCDPIPTGVGSTEQSLIGGARGARPVEQVTRLAAELVCAMETEHARGIVQFRSSLQSPENGREVVHGF
jgi:hypothetical protein